MNFRGIDLLGISEAEAREVRGAQIGMIFQDPMSSLNPVLTIGRQLTETLQRHQKLDLRAARRRAVELLKMVEIPQPEHRLGNYPHQFSGGMRQRVMIAIALSCNPKLIIADEATTALDVTVQAQIIELVKRLTRDRGTSVIWISHDLGIVAGMCDRVNVMYAGRVMETGPVDAVFYQPRHGYTIGLMASTPRIDDALARLVPIEGAPPELLAPARRCPFLPRCKISVAACRERMPPMRDFGGHHLAACFAEPGAA